MRKRFIAVLLALGMVLTLPGTAWAEELAQGHAAPTEAENFQSNDLSASVDDNVYENADDANNFYLPENTGEIMPKADILTYGVLSYRIINGVIEITDCNADVISVDIPSQINGYPVTTIGYQAFYECRGLTSVTIPSSVTVIGERAFSYCYGLTSVTIPNSVTVIGNGAFYSCRSLTSVTIPSSVTQIGASAFSGCSGLTGVTIPSSVTSIGENAFFDCSGLMSVTIPSSVVKMESRVFERCPKLINAGPIGGNYNIEFGWTAAIPDSAFSGCDTLTSIIIPDDITSIGSSAFHGCHSLTDIVLPDSLTTIGSHVFAYCYSLSKIVIPASVTSVGGAIFSSCTKLITAGPIGGDYNIQFGWSQSIPDSALSNASSLTSVAIPNSVTAIGRLAFAECSSLLSLTIPSNVVTIGQGAFFGCSSLSHVSIPNSVTSIGSSAFNNCSNLMSVVIPGSVKSAGSHLFVGSPNLVTAGPVGGDYNIQFGWTDSFNVGDIMHPDLQQLTIPDGVTALYESSRVGSKSHSLSTVIIPESVKQVGQDEHSYGNIQWGLFEMHPNLVSAGPIGGDYSIQFGWTNNIPACAFAKSYIEYADIPEGITHIDTYAFDKCTNLTQIVLPNSLTSIGDSAFRSCDNLTDAYYSGSKSDWEAVKIYENNAPLLNATIHYNSTGPDDLDQETISGVLRSGETWEIRWACTYEQDDTGTPYNGKINITMTGSGNKDELYIYNENSSQGFPWELAPYNIPKSAIKSLTISGEMVGKRLRIAANSFQKYESLEKVLLDDVTGIDTYAFEGCSSLKSVGFLFAAEFASIGKGAFRNCTSLEQIDIPANLERIGEEAFQNTALKTITLGRNITEIGANAFAGCANLKIRCYENSVAHRYAVENNIPFELVKPLEMTIYYGNGQEEPFAHNLEYYLAQTASTEYSPKLAHMMMALSYSAYNKNDIQKSFTNLGFTPANTYYDFAQDESRDLISYAFAKKTLPSGKRLVLVTIKGSSEFGLPHLDWLSNLEIGPVASIGCAWHAGFMEAADEVFGRLRTFVGNDFSNTIFAVTGHSRGGATANLLEIRLFENKVPQENVYGYNFACPDVATGYPMVWNWSGEHNNMFNIAAAGDPVSVLPGKLITLLPGTSWGKFGESRWFASNWNNLMETTLDISNHNPAGYLEFMRKEVAFSELKDWLSRVAIFTANELETVGKLFWINCPVDVSIMDKDGKVIASVIDGIADYHDSPFGQVIILTNGDRKAIYVQGTSSLTVQLIGTDAGLMDYTVQTINLETEDVLSEKSFASVELSAGKKMLSMTDVESITGVGTDVSRVPLYVLGPDDTPEKEVLPDGNGTEIPIKKPDSPDNPDIPIPNTYTITFDPNGGSVVPASAKTTIDGKLAVLPVPTRANYSFQGWYTAINGGVAITIDTVFTQDTTMYARWSYNGSGGPNGGGGSTGGDIGYPSGSTGGDASAPSYSITVPATDGGTVTVSPQSAQKGSTVTITTVPNSGYELLSLIVNDSSGKEILLTDKGNGKYTFIMPGGKVAISAKFKTVQPTTGTTPAVPWSNPFTDVSEENWYYDAVRFVGENGLMNGISSNVFAPDSDLSRAMLAQILYNKEGKPSVAESNAFTDVVPGEWYSNAVTWAAANNIVGGYGNSLFGSNDNITREQLAVMLWRYAGEPVATSKEVHFSDATQISGYALNAIKWAIEKGIINGKGFDVLDPKGFATRAQVAQMLKNYLSK